MTKKDPLFPPVFPPPVEPLYDYEPWKSPTFIPGAPHNLPRDRLRPRGPNLVGGVGALADAPHNPDAFLQPVIERHRYANLIEIPFSVGVVSQQLLQTPVGLRNFLFFRNASTIVATIYFGFGSQASLQSTLALTQGQQALFDTVIPQNEVYVISDTPGALVVAAYSNFSPV